MNEPTNVNTNDTNNDILRVLTREGVLINVSVRYWRAAKRLKAEDLGLDPDNVSERLVNLGQKRLLPKEAIAPLSLIEGRAHALVEATTFPFLGGIGHFLPNAKLAEVRDRLEELRGEFDRACSSFLDHYGEHRVEAIEEWRALAARLSDSPERLVTAIRESFPPAHKVAKKFGFEVHLFQVAVPEQVSAELVTFGEQAEVLNARRQAARQAQEQIRSGVESFVAECVTTLREQTAQLCEEMLESMRSGKTDGVHQKTLNRLGRFIEEFRQLNFANDTEMERRLETVRRELLTVSAEDYRQSPRATRNLQEGLAQVRDHARELAQQDARELVERFGQMGRRKLHLVS